MLTRTYLLLGTLLLAVSPLPLQAELKMPAVFSNHMVMQRNKPIAVWGWDEAGTEVSVKMGDAQASAKAAADGKWQVNLPAQSAGGPFKMVVSGSDNKTFADVLIGEVWLCSGQSNMEWVVRNTNNSAEEIANAKYPQIRHIKIQHRPADKPMTDVPSDGWQVCSPETVPNFTAVGYYFARHLQQELKVPIGLLGSNWGGTRIEPWTPPEGFRQVDALKGIADKLSDFPTKNKNGKINHQSALALYNGMIHPLVPYSMQGAIWYQGESNNGERMMYHEKMKALIQGWRTVWNDREMPFYFVQLAPYRYGGNKALELPYIWEAQLESLKVPHTGMAVTVDIGNVKDIHPRNKQDVGKRLALWALAKNYGKKDLVYSGPVYKSMKIEEDTIRLHFDHVAGGLMSRDDQPLSWFTIAGKDGKFVKAEARVDGSTVVVSSPDVKQPTQVRFGWDQLAEPNLSNKAGLPASPFRTNPE